jgi:hypothetical protein
MRRELIGAIGGVAASHLWKPRSRPRAFLVSCPVWPRGG